MTVIEILGLALLVAVVLAIAVIAVRRVMLTKSGSIDICWRMVGRARWSLGQGRYSGDHLDLFRSFSVLPTASRVLLRRTLALGTRREPQGTEVDLLPPSCVIVRCTEAGADLELAMSEDDLTGLRSWLESAPSAPWSEQR